MGALLLGLRVQELARAKADTEMVQSRAQDLAKDVADREAEVRGSGLRGGLLRRRPTFWAKLNGIVQTVYRFNFRLISGIAVLDL